MIFDWKNSKEEALANGIYEKEIFTTIYIMMKATNKVVAHHTFRNFEKLEFEEGTLIEDCVFEDCGTITFDECRIENCSFARIDTIFSTRSNFTNSNFRELVCENDMVISLEDSEISHCSFEDVELREDSYLCDGVGTSWIEHSSFSNIRTSREDKEIIICEETVGKNFKRKKQFCIIDEDTCTGLACIAGLDGAIEIGHFDLT